LKKPDVENKPSYEKEKYLPTYIDRISFDPKKDFTGLYLTIKCDPQGSCLNETMMGILREKNIPYQLIVDKATASERTFYGVLDFSDKSESKAAIEKEIRAHFGNSLVSLEFTNTNIPGLAYNVKGFPLVLEVIGSPVSVTAFTLPFLSYTFRAIYETFGVGGLSIIWLSGRESIESIRPLKNLALDNRQKIEVALIQLQLLGWGTFELVELSAKNFVVRVYNNFECIATKDLKGYQNSFMRGVMTGLASILADKKGNCVEKRCIRRGDSCCEYSLE
jgi:hypothetical protein